MDLRIDATPSELYFKAIAYSVSIRMALIAGNRRPEQGSGASTARAGDD